MPSSAVASAREILTRLHDVMAGRSPAQAKLNAVVGIIAEAMDSEVCSIYLLREGVLELFATKWTSMVLHTLSARHGGAARTGVLHRSLPGISKKMLTQTLRDLEASGLLSRHVQSAIPPAVEYRLTDLGRRFVEPVELLYAWGRDNADALDALHPRATSRRA